MYERAAKVVAVWDTEWDVLQSCWLLYVPATPHERISLEWMLHSFPLYLHHNQRKIIF
jgi:hypothetical protein